MSPQYTHGDGPPVQVIDKTRPLAKEDVLCAWGHDKPHTIRKGEQHIRVVYKVNGKFESDHICLTCWCGVEDRGPDPYDVNPGGQNQPGG